MSWLVGGLSVLVVALGAAVAVLWRRVTELDRSRAKVHRMGEAITLLTETAEAGFAAVATEIEKLQRTPARPATTRTTVSRRVVKATAQGERVEEIARREALSEGEVRLHLAMASPQSGQDLRSIVVPGPKLEPIKRGGRRASLRA
jgi:hypothetical protein